LSRPTSFALQSIVARGTFLSREASVADHISRPVLPEIIPWASGRGPPGSCTVTLRSPSRATTPWEIGVASVFCRPGWENRRKPVSLLFSIRVQRLGVAPLLANWCMCCWLSYRGHSAAASSKRARPGLWDQPPCLSCPRRPGRRAARPGRTPKCEVDDRQRRFPNRDHPGRAVMSPSPWAACDVPLAFAL
jgi:hypothetical protein